MITIYKKANTIYLVAVKTLDEIDHKQLLLTLEDHLKHHKNVHLYIEMNDFEGWSASTYWKGIVLNVPNEQLLTKVAIVGSVQWYEQLTEALLPFSKAHIKFYGQDEKDFAKEWIKKQST